MKLLARMLVAAMLVCATAIAARAAEPITIRLDEKGKVVFIQRIDFPAP